MMWLTPLIPSLGRQRQVDFWVLGQPGLQGEFQDSQGYTEKPYLKQPPPSKKKMWPLGKTVQQLTKTFKPITILCLSDPANEYHCTLHIVLSKELKVQQVTAQSCYLQSWKVVQAECLLIVMWIAKWDTQNIHSRH